jgi:hypothetical protein
MEYLQHRKVRIKSVVMVKIKNGASPLSLLHHLTSKEVNS